MLRWIVPIGARQRLCCATETTVRTNISPDRAAGTNDILPIFVPPKKSERRTVYCEESILVFVLLEIIVFIIFLSN